MDEELAAFTDRLLSDQPVEESGVNQESAALEATLFRLKATAKDATNEVLRQRIEKELVREWKKDLVANQKQESGWQRFLPGSRPQQSQGRPTWALTLGVVILALVVIALLPAGPSITSNMQATAGTAGQNQIILFGLAVVVIIGLLFVGRKRS